VKGAPFANRLQAAKKTVAADTRKISGGSQSGAKRTGSGKKTGIFSRLAGLYARMEQAYQACASVAGLSCAGCENNCCTSFFQHHTYVEWAYLWRGIGELPAKRRKQLVERAKDYLADARRSLSADMTPEVMCPLNENGLCLLYTYRMMICRMHGTRNSLVLPDGRRRIFPGCSRFSSLPCAKNATPGTGGGELFVSPAGEKEQTTCPTLDRTPFYAELAALEMEFSARASRPLPRVDLTLAEMLVMGPPKLSRGNTG
jgi:hypothetical protein